MGKLHTKCKNCGYPEKNTELFCSACGYETDKSRRINQRALNQANKVAKLMGF